MTIIRTHFEKEFVVLSTKTCTDSNLSFQARGFLAYANSKPTNWHFHVNQIASEQKCGKDRIMSCIHELEEQRYLYKYQPRCPETNQFLPIEYIIFNRQYSEEELEEFKKSLPQRGFPLTAPPLPANPQLISIDNNKKGDIQRTNNPLPPSKGGQLDLSTHQREELSKRLEFIKEYKPEEFEAIVAMDGSFDEKLKAVNFVKLESFKGNKVESVSNYVSWALRKKPVIDMKAYGEMEAVESIPDNYKFAKSFKYDEIMILVDNKSVELHSFINNVHFEKREIMLNMDHVSFKGALGLNCHEMAAKRSDAISEQLKRNEDVRKMCDARKAQESGAIESFSNIELDGQLVHDR